MKRRISPYLAVIACLLFSFNLSQAQQDMTVKNHSNCDVLFYASASYNCVPQQTVTYVVHAGNSIDVEMADPATWLNGTPPSSRHEWSLVKCWLPIGPYVINDTCPNISTNGTVVAPKPMCGSIVDDYNCANLTSNNNCGSVMEATWTTLMNGNVIVNIY